jgi:hypothetical protein
MALEIAPIVVWAPRLTEAPESVVAGEHREAWRRRAVLLKVQFNTPDGVRPPQKWRAGDPWCGFSKAVGEVNLSTGWDLLARFSAEEPKLSVNTRSLQLDDPRPIACDSPSSDLTDHRLVPRLMTLAGCIARVAHDERSPRWFAGDTRRSPSGHRGAP